MNLSEMRNDCSLLDTINPSHCKLSEKSPVFSSFFLEPCLIPHGFMVIFPNSHYRVMSWNSVALFSRSTNRQLLFGVFARLRRVFLPSRLVFESNLLCWDASRVLLTIDKPVYCNKTKSSRVFTSGKQTKKGINQWDKQRPSCTAAAWPLS